MRDVSTTMMNDHDLIHGGVLDLVEENRASARRWAGMVEIHRRQPDPAETALPGWGAMSAREWTALEVAEAWALGDQYARTQLNVALFLTEHLPDVWQLCLEGALDRYRATIVADLLRHRLDTASDWAVAAVKITAFLRKHLCTYPEFNTAMVTCTITQLRNRLNYIVRCLVSTDDDFQRAFEDRSVSTFLSDDGLGQLTMTGTVDQVQLAAHRLHLSAKELRDAGDRRTVKQLMSDLALDLIIGRAAGAPVPRYARPIINVTVPLETLAGVRDDPATLSGGRVIPADLARAIATREGATWFRLLTDSDDQPVSLSTTSYQPTAVIWRHVLATTPTCAHPRCDRPSAECELDHRVPWPTGTTAADNLDPLCRRHHKAKHARAQRALRADLDWEFQQAG